MEIRDWTATRLWSELQLGSDAESRAVAALLAKSMPDIQAVLAQGGTAETDFTLHDSGHSFRVAQRMIDVIPGKSLAALSCYEQALLLLSAYLHDIGMTPRMRVIAEIHRYLLTGDPQDLPRAELDCLQQWLDDFRGGIVPPIAVAETTVAVLETVEELVTYYARHRHNDWSEQWTREYFGEAKLGTYAGWLEDLVLLCRSHHYGYDELRADTFRPRLVGAGGAVVNLRYLAAVLRIADVLEFDPERTPPVVFNHRDVNAGSVIYWHKDHDISMKIDNGRVLVYARPTSARIHKAIEDTVAQIDDELAVCKRLAEEVPFNVCPFLSQATAHEWNLASTTHASIEPLRHAYEYINGAFRPNTSRILNLLSGIELYGSPFAAVRELLQNAMDAVREQIAYVRLRRSNPADEVHARELSRSHVISLRIEADDQGYWLICADSGVGMSKRIICDYLLVSGQSQRHDLCELERRCHLSGFSVGRTGQFGIGVLSYFMIARRVEISSRRSHESGSSESHGWHFASDGIGTFGELKIDKRIEPGSTVRLLLRPNVLADSPQAWATELFKYLLGTLHRLPCRFEVAADALGLAPMALEPGWTSTIENLREAIWARLDARFTEEQRRDIPAELMPANDRAKTLESYESWQEAGIAMRNAMRCDVREGVLPNGAGTFRSRVVYFDLTGGLSLRFLQLRGRNGNELMRIGGRHSVCVFAKLASSWKGITTSIYTSDGRLGREVEHIRRRWQTPSNVMLEIDWSTGGAVSVDRQHLRLSSSGEESWEYALTQAREHVCAFSATTRVSRYYTLNSRLVAGGDPITDPYWIVRTEQDGDTWQRVRFPAIDAPAYLSNNASGPSFHCNGSNVSLLSWLSANDSYDTYFDGIAWHSAAVPPSRILLFPDDHYHRLVPLWDRMEKETTGRFLAPFPPFAIPLIGAAFVRYAGATERQTVWNPHHRIIKAITDEAWEWCNSTFSKVVDPLLYEDGILRNRAHACAWLAHSAAAGEADVWRGLIERKPSFLAQVFSLAFGSGAHSALLFWSEEPPRSNMRVLTSVGWHVERVNSALAKLLSLSDPKWVITEVSAPGQENPQRPAKQKRATRPARKRVRRAN